MQITWFVLFYMIQAWTKEYYREKNKKTLEFKLKIKLIGSFIYDKIQSTDFLLHYLRHWRKGTYLAFL